MIPSKVTGSVKGCVQVRVLLLSITAKGSEIPKSSKTTAITSSMVAKDAIMAKKSKLTPHYFLGICPQILVQKLLPARPDHVSGATIFPEVVRHR